jgi:hypothetical protein
MTSLFRRRGKEPPSTGHYSLTRRRQPVDPPSSMQISEPSAPTSTCRNGDPEQCRDEMYPRHDCGPPKPSSPPDNRKRIHSFEDQEDVEFEDENENRPVVDMMEHTKQADRKVQMELSSGLASSRGASNGTAQRPFSTKSNQETMSKSLVLASKMNRDSRASAGRSSVFRKKLLSSDNDTVTSAKSAATTKSAATASRTSLTKKLSSGSSTTISDHDKAALRRLLGTSAPLEVKPSFPSLSSVPITKISKPVKPTEESPKPLPPVDEEFDQKEYLRSLISSKVAKKTTPTTHKAVSESTTSNNTKPTLPSLQANNECVKVKQGANAIAARITCSPKSNLTSSSSASADQKAMLRMVLAKTMHKKNNDEQARRKLSPKNDLSKLESAAVSLSRKVLSDQSKPLTPKKSHKLNFKGYVRSKMGLSKKASNASPKSKSSSDATYPFDSGLANASSIDSAESSMAGSRSISQAASHSTDSSDDDKTKTTLASSSNESGETKNSYDSSLKGLMTAETIDTDESSTIMGNLQSASSDSMQYSSEEGCDDNTAINQSVFQAIDNLAQKTSRRALPPFVSSAKQDNLLDAKSSNHNPSKSKSSAVTKQNLGYSKFLKALQSEASGSHSQVSSEFCCFSPAMEEVCL